MSVLITQSQIYFATILFQAACPFFLRMNKDHGTDFNLGKLHVCLQLYFTYSIYHLQTIPQRNMYQTFEKSEDLMTICFPFICFRCCRRFHLLVRFFLVYILNIVSCHVHHLFSFVLCAFTFINYISWNYIATIKQRGIEKKYIEDWSEVYICNVIIEFWSNVNDKCFHIAFEKKKIKMPPSTLLTYRNMQFVSFRTCHRKNVLGYTLRKTVKYCSIFINMFSWSQPLGWEIIP